MSDFDLWEESLPPHEKLSLAGDDLGEKPREVEGEALTDDDVAAFARALGTEFEP